LAKRQTNRELATKVMSCFKCRAEILYREWNFNDGLCEECNGKWEFGDPYRAKKGLPLKDPSLFSWGSR
jgi:hypothetical protein